MNGVSTGQRSDLAPLDERDQLEPSLLTMPVAVRTLLHIVFTPVPLARCCQWVTLGTVFACRCARRSAVLHFATMSQH